MAAPIEETKPEKFGPWEFSQAVNAFLADAKRRYEEENPDLELDIRWSWTSKVRKPPKAPKVKQPANGGLFKEAH